MSDFNQKYFSEAKPMFSSGPVTSIVCAPGFTPDSVCNPTSPLNAVDSEHLSGAGVMM